MKSITLNLTRTEANRLHELLKTIGASGTTNIIRKLYVEMLELPPPLTVVPPVVPSHVPVAYVTTHLPAAVNVLVGPDLVIAVRKSVEGLDLRMQKIQAIKNLREVTNMGLADSKWAVENIVPFIQFVEASGRLPKEGLAFLNPNLQ